MGDYENLLEELRVEQRGGFKNFLRLDEATFQHILGRIEHRITKSSSGRPPLAAGLRLAITLRFLATGDSYQSLQYAFRVAHNTISLLVPQVCEAIVEEFKDEQFNTPTTQAEWQAVADKFATRWNFSHCCGAIDGKHVRIRKPRHAGTLYYNYKGYHSIVLLGLVDADYKFLWANVGAEGSQSDCGIFNRSALEPALREGTLGMPDPSPLPHDDRDIPYFMVGDDAFPLREYMIKPYSARVLDHDQRIFNYRCSRARRVVENAFGILAGRFRCLLGSLDVTPRTASKITQACLVLHNVIRDLNPALQNADLDVVQDDGDIVPGAWRQGAVLDNGDPARRGPRRNEAGKELRDYLKAYYNSPVGSVPWQEAAINR